SGAAGPLSVALARCAGGAKMTALSFHNLGFSYGTAPILTGLDLQIPTGEITVIMGASGCGKTTLINLAAGLLTPDQGRVERQVTRLAVVFQDPALLPWRSAIENVGFALAGLRLDRAERQARAAQYLVEAGLAPADHDKYPGQLSGGMRQRVALARALAVEPDLLLCDEPFAALDHDLRAELRSKLKALHQRAGMTTLFVTHDREEALELADQLVLLDQGKVAQVGAAGELLASATE
ncbi:MAG: ABC transporter ATP-binding protein, partial [Maritimibacter sp.]